MKLHVLGTGDGDALKCYNTCFCLENKGQFFLIDGGGGNQILTQLQKVKIDFTKINNILLTHNHMDHIIGVVWVVRRICAKIYLNNSYEGNLNIYASQEGVEVLISLLESLFPIAKKYFNNRIFFNEIKDGQTKNIIDIDFNFFDIEAKKEKQYGFLINSQILFAGDEPLTLANFKNVKWLFHEAMCLQSEEETVQAYKKGHCTVKEAAETASKINAENLILWHTEDNDLKNRKELYTAEAEKYFKGKIYVPNDLEVIEL